MYDTSYMCWKGWEGRFTYNTRQAECFSGEFKAYKLNGMNILEIGFGDGAFLAWAQKQGANVYGTELISELVEAGEKKGFKVFFGEIDQIRELMGRKFDLIVAFDVFEHIQVDKLKLHLRVLRDLLSQRGELICRFPNGESPLGRIYQHADITHVSVLSGPIMKQLCGEVSLEVIEYRNPYRFRGKGSKRLLRIASYVFRNMVHFCVAKAYLLGNTPLDPNVVVRIKRSG